MRCGGRRAERTWPMPSSTTRVSTTSSTPGTERSSTPPLSSSPTPRSAPQNYNYNLFKSSLLKTDLSPLLKERNNTATLRSRTYKNIIIRFLFSSHRRYTNFTLIVPWALWKKSISMHFLDVGFACCIVWSECDRFFSTREDWIFVPFYPAL